MTTVKVKNLFSGGISPKAKFCFPVRKSLPQIFHPWVKREKVWQISLVSLFYLVKWGFREGIPARKTFHPRPVSPDPAASSGRESQKQPNQKSYEKFFHLTCYP